MISFFHTEKNDQTREQKLANWVYHADLITNILGFPDVFQSVPFREGGEYGYAHSLISTKCHPNITFFKIWITFKKKKFRDINLPRTNLFSYESYILFKVFLA